MVRVGASVLIAVGVTYGLFTFMRLLVAMTDMGLQEYDKRKQIDLFRVRQDSRAETKKRELPMKAKAEKPPETPKFDMSNSGGPGAQAIAVSAPKIETSVALKGGLNLGAAPADTNAVPVVRVEPITPRRAQVEGIEGWCLVKFDISTTGATQNVKASCQPRGIFERATETAVKKWKYKPKVVDGKALLQRGLKVKLSFKLD
ncbi:MAG: energy transducer TonB [Deltaproteobacteria bacterium]|jgi:protein TonB